MKFKFQDDLSYQSDAINAVVQLFDGQPVFNRNPIEILAPLDDMQRHTGLICRIGYWRISINLLGNHRRGQRQHESDKQEQGERDKRDRAPFHDNNLMT